MVPKTFGAFCSGFSWDPQEMARVLEEECAGAGPPGPPGPVGKCRKNKKSFLGNIRRNYAQNVHFVFKIFRIV